MLGVYFCLLLRFGYHQSHQSAPLGHDKQVEQCDAIFNNSAPPPQSSAKLAGAGTAGASPSVPIPPSSSAISSRNLATPNPDC
jgi:hypothetical protein